MKLPHNIKSKNEMDTDRTSSGNIKSMKEVTNKLKKYKSSISYEEKITDKGATELLNYSVTKCREDTNNVSPIDADKRRNAKLFKKRSEVEKPNSGQSIVDFINNKMKEFESELFEDKSIKKKKHKALPKKIKLLDEKHMNTILEAYDISNNIVEGECATTNIKSYKKKKHKENFQEYLHNGQLVFQNSDINKINNIEEECLSGNVKSYKKKKHRKFVQEDLYSTPNVFQNSDLDKINNKSDTSTKNTKLQKKKLRLLQEHVFQNNDTNTSHVYKERAINGIGNEFNTSKKETHLRNEISKTYEHTSNGECVSENIKLHKKKKHKFSQNNEVNNTTSESNISTEGTHLEITKRKRSERLQALDSSFNGHTQDLKIRKKKQKKHDVESVNDEQRSRNGSEFVTETKTDHKKKLDYKDTIKNSLHKEAIKYAIHDNSEIFNDSQNENIIESSIPESNYLVLIKPKQLSKKVVDSIETDTNIIESSIQEKCEKNNTEISKTLVTTMPLDSQMEIDTGNILPLSPSYNITVDSDRSELLVSAVGVSVLSHKNEHGIVESNTSQVYARPCSDDTFSMFTEKSASTETFVDGKSSDSDESTQLLFSNTNLINMTEKYISRANKISNIKNGVCEKEKDVTKTNGSHTNSDIYVNNNENKLLIESSVYKNDVDVSFKKHKRRTSSKSLKDDTTTDESNSEIESNVSKTSKYIKSFNVKDIDEVKDALDASLFNKTLFLKDEDVWALENMYITIPWAIPLAHTIETRMSSVPTKTQQQEFKRLRIELKTGPYTAEEDETIRANWIEFCALHNIPPNPLPFLNFIVNRHTIINRTERVKFVQYIGRGLENRMLYSIYTRFRKLFLKVNKGKYASDEDETIRTYTNNCDTPSKFSELAVLLNRDRNSVIKRYHTLTFQQDQKWKLPIYRKIIEQLIVLTRVESVDDLKHAEISNEHWKVVVSNLHLKTSPSKVKRKWENYMHPKLFNHEKIHAKIKKKLINILYDDDDETDQQDINWNHLAQDFDGFSGDALQKIFADMLHEHVPVNLHNDFRASVSYLKNDCLEIYKKQVGSSNFVYKDGILSIC